MLTPVLSCTVGGNCGEEDLGTSSQQVHCLLGLRLPVKNRAVSDHDYHEWRRPEVRSFELKVTDMLSTQSRVGIIIYRVSLDDFPSLLCH